MGHYLVAATRDLSAAVSTPCTSFYVPFPGLAVVSFAGSADALARRLDRDRTGGRCRRVGAAAGRVARIDADLMVTRLALCVLT
jgi:hypothetical protein